MKAHHPLLKLAQDQSGLFTSQQAINSGVDSRNHSYYLKVGHWLRVARGVYKLNLAKENSRKNFFFYQLLMSSKKGEIVGAFSHETALYLMGFKLNTPDRLHITVPVQFRKNLKNFKDLIVHYEDLQPSEKIQKYNLYMTSVKKTFQDLLLKNAVYHPEWIKQQFKKAIEQNLISSEELRDAFPSKKMNDKEKSIFKAVLFEIFG